MDESSVSYFIVRVAAVGTLWFLLVFGYHGLKCLPDDLSGWDDYEECSVHRKKAKNSFKWALLFLILLGAWR